MVRQHDEMSKENIFLETSCPEVPPAPLRQPVVAGASLLAPSAARSFHRAIVRSVETMVVRRGDKPMARTKTKAIPAAASGGQGGRGPSPLHPLPHNWLVTDGRQLKRR